ncbi:MAG: hypothetical protein EPO63_04300 [Candidatus Nitrosotenuis sp.]|nr:MAG: hypothetical protein EPO63_04300 [Candidatus Nitrosotenuis sp.]
MSKKENLNVENESLIDFLKDNYVKRIDEVDAFSKRVSTAYSEVSTEFLYGWLNLTQHYLDLQKSHLNQMPTLVYPELIRKITTQNTEVWIQAVQNIDNVCIDCLKSMKNDLRAINKNSILFLQNTRKMYDIYSNFYEQNLFEFDDKSKEKLAPKQ